eukprot:6617279-Alexandrium_andersonii.AAC.1
MADQMKYLAATGGVAELHALVVYICILHSHSLDACIRLQPRVDSAKSARPARPVSYTHLTLPTICSV